MKMSRKCAAMMTVLALCVGGNVMAENLSYGGDSNWENKNGGGEYQNVSKNAFFNSGTDNTIGKAGDTITFSGIAKGGTNYHAMVVTGNGTEVAVTADTIYVGSKDAGDFRGFRVTGQTGNKLTVHANTFVSYTGDEIAHARNGVNTINLGTEDNPINYFEAHTTWGKDDFGVALLQANEGSTVNLYANKAILDGSTSAAGGVIGSGGWGTVNVNVKDLTIDGNICGTYGKMSTDGKAATLNITADTLNMKGDVNIGSAGDGNSNFNRDTKVNIKVADSAVIDGNVNVVGNAGSTAKASDQSELTLEFNGDSKITGDINVEGSTTTQNATVNLGGTGDMTASKGSFKVTNSGNVNFTGGTWAVKEWSGDGSGDASVGENATVDISASEMKTETLAINGVTNLVGGKANVTTNTLSSTGKVVTDDVNNSIIATKKAEETNISLHGTGNVADQIAADSSNAKKFLNTLTVGEENSKESVVKEATTDEGIIGGATTVKAGENGEVNVATAVNASDQAISNMATLSLMTWRQENNDMNKRLGELRASEGKQGVWVRMARGQAKYGAQSIKNQYNYYQLGYDSKISGDWILGGAVTYTDGESSFTNGTGTNKHTGFAIYGSNLKSDGSFIDIIAKYAHMENDFDVNGGVGTGEYSTNGYSFSAEYGKRFQQDGFWIEPQAELTYGKVSSADFTTKNGASVHQDSMDSLVGRLGFSLGKDIKRGNVYVRASYLYDFKGDVNVSMSKDGADSAFKTDLGGGWWEFGVGTNLSLGHDTHFYLDVETTAGGDVDTPWQWNAGVRFSF